MALLLLLDTMIQEYGIHGARMVDRLHGFTIPWPSKERLEGTVDMMYSRRWNLTTRDHGDPVCRSQTKTKVLPGLPLKEKRRPV